MSGLVMWTIVLVCAVGSVMFIVGLLLGGQRQLSPDVPLVAPASESDPLDIDAAGLVHEMAFLDASGEYKNHQVFAKLRKAHPERSGADCQWAIQKAYRRMKGLTL